MSHTRVSRTTACSFWLLPYFHCPQCTSPIRFVTRTYINMHIRIVVKLQVVPLPVGTGARCPVCGTFIFRWSSLRLVVSLALLFLFPFFSLIGIRIDHLSNKEVLSTYQFTAKVCLASSLFPGISEDIFWCLIVQHVATFRWSV